MISNRLGEVAFIFPAGPFSEALLAFLGGAPTCLKTSRGIRFAPLYPPDGQPAFAVRQESAAYPQVLFVVDRPIQVQAGRLCLSSTLEPGPAGDTGPLADPHLPPRLPFERLVALLDGAGAGQSPLLGLDHAGVDLPPDLLPRQEWERFTAELAGVCCLYRYPEGQDWPFIIPASPAEYDADITQFSGMREPKFELAYDAFNRIPGLHFHLRTRLPKEVLLARLAAPYGFDLAPEATFRSVFVEHPWPGLNLRFDLGFATEARLTDWDTGEWLVKEGGRI